MFIEGGGTRDLSPTFADTIMNPPYAHVPRRKGNMYKINGGAPGYNLRLAKKCYYDKELPWTKS